MHHTYFDFMYYQLFVFTSSLYSRYPIYSRVVLSNVEKKIMILSVSPFCMVSIYIKKQHEIFYKLYLILKGSSSNPKLTQ